MRRFMSIMCSCVSALSVPRSVTSSGIMLSASLPCGHTCINAAFLSAMHAHAQAHLCHTYVICCTPICLACMSPAAAYACFTFELPVSANTHVADATDFRVFQNYLELRHTQHSAAKGRGLPGHQCLQGCDQGCCCWHRVDVEVGDGRMAPTAPHCELECVGLCDSQAAASSAGAARAESILWLSAVARAHTAGRVAVLDAAAAEHVVVLLT
jgi:hypothetical protein